MKIESKHIATYLNPHIKANCNGLIGEIIWVSKFECGVRMEFQEETHNTYKIEKVKMLLLPLSHLKDLGRFWGDEMHAKLQYYEGDVNCMRHSDVLELIEEGFDIFGLIDSGDAINILERNT